MSEELILVSESEVECGPPIEGATLECTVGPFAEDGAGEALRGALAEALAARQALRQTTEALGRRGAGATRTAHQAVERGLDELRRALLRLGEAALDAHLAEGLDAPEPGVAAPTEPRGSDEEPTPSAAPSADQAVVLSRPDAPARARVDAEVLKELQRRLNEGDFSDAQDEESEHDWHLTAWERLGPVPSDVHSVTAFSDEYNRLRSASDPAYLKRWVTLPRARQVKMAEHLVARLRRLQQELPDALRPTHARGDNAFRIIVRDLHAHLSSHRVGFAHGLAWAHAPRRESWYADACALHARLDRWLFGADEQPDEDFNPERALDELCGDLSRGMSDEELRARVRLMLDHGVSAQDPRLCDLLQDHLPQLTGPDFRALRTGIRRLAAEQAEGEVEDDREVWPVANVLEGKRLVLVGGDRHAQVRQRLEAHLPGVSLDWIETSPSGGIRQVQSLVYSIGHGSVDLVLLVQAFLSHKVSRAIIDAARTAPRQVQVEAIRRGYGAAAIRRALKRCVKQGR